MQAEFSSIEGSFTNHEPTLLLGIQVPAGHMMSVNPPAGKVATAAKSRKQRSGGAEWKP